MKKLYDSYITELPFSRSFQQACLQNQVFLLRELLEMPVTEPGTISWLTTTMLDELAVFVRNNISEDTRGE